MTTARDKDQTFARLFRMMDSSSEGEALSAFRQARRMLHKDHATFGAILDHTQHLNETNTALGEQNRDLQLENEKYRSRSNQRGFKRAALARFGQFATWLPLTAATPFDRDEPSGEGVADPPRWFRFPWKNIPQDLRTILGLFAIMAATTISCHMLTANNNAAGPKSTSPGRGWLARLPLSFSVDHPPWCPACRRQQTHPDTDRQGKYGRMF